MTSKIKVDNINKVSDDSNIIKKCGTTTTIGSGASNPIVVDGSAVTLGRCGGTVALASGASQSGFGRTGTVDWQTAIKTGDFTGVSGEGYFINTTSGTITMTLPSSPSVGDIVAFKDYAGTFQTNNLTIDRNGSNIIGGTLNPVIAVEGQSVVLVYGDATEGWQAVEAATNADLPRPSFVVATGGTITTSGNDKIHTFTGPGTFTVCSLSTTPANNQVSYMVVAGGGAGGGSPSGEGGGGGGAGGYRETKSPVTPYTASPLDGQPSAPNRITVTATSFPITVGGGAAIGSDNTGSNSVFSSITSAGGGSGGASHNSSGNAGGSGGGGTGRSGNSGGSGNSPSTTPAQGNNGGTTTPVSANPDTGGGGGGATAVGANGAPGGPAGDGGAGATTSINGSPTAFAGGGGGAKDNDSPNGGSAGDGGVGGGGNGASTCASPRPATAGTVNTGGGGGGQAHNPKPAGAGGSGIVIIRYKFQ